MERFVKSRSTSVMFNLSVIVELMCDRYPALKRLMDLKASQVDAGSHPPLYIQLASSHPTSLATALSPTRFDVILITPNQGWDETAALPIRHLSADPGFVFLWVGKGDEDGLERGRACFAKWGFRRAEDIVWVKTTKRRSASAGGQEEGTGGGGGLLASQKEHCLMGIRGTVRRSTDTRFVHCNVDTDVMVWEDSGGEHIPILASTSFSNLLGRTGFTSISSISVYAHRIILSRYSTSTTILPSQSISTRMGQRIDRTPSSRIKHFTIRFCHISRPVTREARWSRCITFSQ